VDAAHKQNETLNQEIEKLRSIFMENMVGIPPEFGYYRSFQVHIFPRKLKLSVQDEKASDNAEFYMFLIFNVPKEYPE